MLINRIMTRIVIHVVALGLTLHADAALGDRVIYVDDDAAGAHDGTSWVDAYVDLQDALEDIRTYGGCPCEVWIAAGRYKPDRGTGDRSMHFALQSGLALYGGFAGWESCLDERDIRANETILDGDLLGNDDDEVPVTSNCCRETNQPGCDDPVCAAAVYDPPANNCANSWGIECAGRAESVCCDLCRPTRCDNSNNVLLARNTNDTAILDGVTVIGGEANATDVDDRGQSLSLFGGGGLYIEGSDAGVRDCTFTRNYASLWGGAIHAREGGDLVIEDAPTIERSVFTQNRAFAGGFSVVDLSTTEAMVTSCDFIGNEGGGLSIGSRKRLFDCRFIDNTGIALDLSSFGSRSVVDCMFVNNRGEVAGAVRSIANATYINCGFYGNYATVFIWSVIDNAFSERFVNCVFSGNDPERVLISGSAKFINCTVTGNSTTLGYTHSDSGSDVFEGSIFWENGRGAGLFYAPTSNINYCCIENLNPTQMGIGNIPADPRLVDPDGADGIIGTLDDDLRFSPGSPAINAGHPNPPILARDDFDGHARTICGRIDMGPYESGIGDYDCDGIVELQDVAGWSGCMGGPDGDSLTSDCEAFDFDADDNIDLADWAAYSAVAREP